MCVFGPSGTRTALTAFTHKAVIGKGGDRDLWYNKPPALRSGHFQRSRFSHGRRSGPPP